MKHLINKSMSYYRNNGATALVKKTAEFGYKKTILRAIQYSGRQNYKELREEYSFISNPIFSITSKDISKSKDIIKSTKLSSVKTINWFVPNFDHLSFGGIYTIFRFIEKAATEGVSNRIIIYDYPAFNTNRLKKDISKNFPLLQNYEIIVFDHANNKVDSLPECDIAVCTFWVSAYLLLKFNKTKRKYYFIQDYEPLFYPGGATSALAESTYRFGFRALVNTPGLLAAINQRHGTEGISFIPAVDQTVYYPDLEKKNETTKIFFYARPSNPRNAFNLGVDIIKNLKKKYGSKIEVVTAGANWQEAAYGLSGKVTNLGLIGSIQEVAELYRSCDIGFVYMLTKHPSYQPFEFMASGMATVTNNNEDNLWFLQDGKNCLLSEPSASAMVERISELVDNKGLRAKIIEGGLKSVGYTWNQQLDMIWNDVKQF